MVYNYEKSGWAVQQGFIDMSSIESAAKSKVSLLFQHSLITSTNASEQDLESSQERTFDLCLSISVGLLAYLAMLRALDVPLYSNALGHHRSRRREAVVHIGPDLRT